MKFRTCREETEAVKIALRRAGIPFTSVRHGMDSTATWLDINLGLMPDPETFKALKARVLGIVQPVTGRGEDYKGQLNILNQ